MATRMGPPNQQRSRGAGWSSGHALRLPAHGQWVRNWLCSAGEVLPNRTSPTEWANTCATNMGQQRDSRLRGSKVPMRLLPQHREIISCQNVAAGQIQGVWWNIQAEDDGSLRPALRYMMDAHGRTCGCRVVRHIKFIST